MVSGLFERLEAQTGIDVEVRYADTPELVTLMLTEGASSPADIIFAQDSGHLGALANAGVLMTLDDDLMNIIDPRFRDDNNQWVATSGRARVLVYNANDVAVSELPQKLSDLSDPKWKGRLGWAPSNGSFQSHVSALRHLWGEDETKSWLTAVMANDPQRFPKNSPQVQAAADGAIALGWVNHYYLHRKTTGDDYGARNHSFSVPGDAGNILMLAGMGIRNGSPRQQAATQVIHWMLSEEAQVAFAQENFEYPTRVGINTHAEVTPVDQLHLATVNQSWLADLGPTRAMLQALGLL